MHVVTTTRIHLAAALLAVCTLTQQGFAIAALLIGVELLRVVARHHLDRTALGPATRVSVDDAGEAAAAARPSLAA
jgi:hypothetical protein